ncbi:nitronate monooxygenase [Stella humosa]|uniref:Nitronate monooxygenase n=1 Tax=Stella humosa TaxID=94 RepID=A0A3N1L1T1_9PROT|nr:nitronate monooxygenase [Stella humosa]ROP83475.1 nitronate monooxygenase [Stella humosa]BBK33252.1 nitronate monooxygenase [Stella humosa]
MSDTDILDRAILDQPLFETPITRLFGIRHPILCGGLMWLADARYVAAAVNAGAMGFITARTFPDFDAFRAELRLCAELTGGKPFGVNLFISGRAEENAVLDRYIDILADEGVRLIETAGNTPEAFLPKLKAAGCIVLHKVSAVRHGLRAEKAGVDALAIVGQECGGHPGLHFVGTMVQGALAARSFRIPFALGGGIGCGEQLVGALGLGADAIVMGSRMTVASEVWAHADYKQKVLATTEADSRLVMASFRNTYRCLDNTAARAVAELEAAGERDFALYMPHVRGTNARDAYTTGDWERGILSMGQSAAFADAIKPVADILAEILTDAARARDRMDRLRPPAG